MQRAGKYTRAKGSFHAGQPTTKGRDVPKLATAKRRDVPSGAEFQTAPSSERREVPRCQVPNSAKFGTSRSSAVSAVWDVALLLMSRRLSSVALPSRERVCVQQVPFFLHEFELPVLLYPLLPFTLKPKVCFSRFSADVGLSGEMPANAEPRPIEKVHSGALPLIP